MQKIEKDVIIAKGGVKPIAPYSPGIKVGQFLFTSGQVGVNPETGKLVTGGVGEQTKQALKNIVKVLEAAGSSADDVIKVTIFLKDMNDYGTVNEIYGQLFTKDPPARSAVQVVALPLNALIEMEAVALIPS